MSTIVFPPSLTPAQATWDLTHNVAGGSNPWGQVQRISRGSPVWSCSFAMPTLEGEDMAIWQAFEAQAARGDVRFYMPHPQKLRGSFDNSELLVNGDFTNGTNGWLSSGSTLTVGSRLLRVEHSASGGQHARQDVTTFSPGEAFVFVAAGLPGNTSALELRVDDDTNTTVKVLDITAPEVGITSYVATDNEYRFRLRIDTSTSGDYGFWSFASVSRCLLVDGSGATGTDFVAKAGPPSTKGVLKVGDMFTVMIDGVPSLHRLTRDLDTDSSGEGTLYFEPALPGSPADNAPIILRNPFCRMYIPSHNASSTYKPPMHGSFALEALEDPTRP